MCIRDSLYSAGKYSEALSVYQSAVRLPSAVPRREIAKQSVYGSAKCTSILFTKGLVPASNYKASWQSVLALFPSGSLERGEAETKLKGVH